jgi:hypothetical protein
MSKTPSQKIDKNFDVSFPRFFLFYRVFGCFSAMGVQKHYTLQKNVLQKNRVERFYKKFDQKSKTDFFSIFSNRIFGRFSVRGVQNTIKKYRKFKSDPIAFSYPHPPTHHRGRRFFFAPWPLGLGTRRRVSGPGQQLPASRQQSLSTAAPAPAPATGRRARRAEGLTEGHGKKKAASSPPCPHSHSHSLLTAHCNNPENRGV